MGLNRPKDVRGNEIFVKDECYVHPKVPFIFQVVSIDEGGIQTPQGVTPTRIRLVCDMFLVQRPGVPFDSILRTVSPTEQSIVEGFASKLPRG